LSLDITYSFGLGTAESILGTAESDEGLGTAESDGDFESMKNVFRTMLRCRLDLAGFSIRETPSESNECDLLKGTFKITPCGTMVGINKSSCRISLLGLDFAPFMILMTLSVINLTCSFPNRLWYVSALMLILVSPVQIFCIIDVRDDVPS
jgi:hypothetical protein